MDSESPIYNLSKTCDDIFLTILGAHGAASALVTDVLHRRFRQWTAYLGVFAPEKISLDTRLRYSESISQLVLQFLQIVLRSLTHISKLDHSLAQNGTISEQYQQRIMEDFNRPATTGHSPPLVESLQGLNVAIEALYRLGIAIRQSTSSSLHERLRHFARENEDVGIENMVYLRLKAKFFDQPQGESNSKSPLSLYKQLANSINIRYLGLLYKRSRQQQLGKTRNLFAIQPQPRERSINQDSQTQTTPRSPAHPNKHGGPSDPKDTMPTGIRPSNQSEKSYDKPSTVDTQKVHQRFAFTRKTFATPKSLFSARIEITEYPNPPKVDPKIREANCPFCGQPCSESSLQKPDWWHEHLEQDLELYVCLSETCAEPPQMFARFQEWYQHMDERHSRNWTSEIHKPLGWFCDIGHEEEYFEDENKYDKHIQQTHSDFEDDKDVLKEWSELRRERPQYTCPICNCIPNELAIILPWLKEGTTFDVKRIESASGVSDLTAKQNAARDKLLLHIGVHLKQLGLLSAAYFVENEGTSAKSSRIGSVPRDKDGKLLFTADPKGYLDPQFESYKSADAPELLAKEVDWSYVTHNGIFHVLLPRNNAFVGQEAFLTQLETILFGKNGTDFLAIGGISGIGKTQLALELAYRTKHTHPQYSVIWISLTDSKTLNKAYIDIAQHFELPGWDDETVDVKMLVVEFLNNTDSGDWLLIFDGVEDFSMWTVTGRQAFSLQLQWQDIVHYIPNSSRGKIVFTTRNKNSLSFVPSSKIVEMLHMEYEDASHLLQQHLSVGDSVDEQGAMDDLLSQLACVPMAIEQAATYIKHSGTTLPGLVSSPTGMEDFLLNFLTALKQKIGTRRADSLLWALRSDLCEPPYMLASECLLFMACIAPKDVPIYLLPSGLSPQDKMDAIEKLDAIFFIKYTPGTPCLDCHTLVHLRLRAHLRHRGELTERILKVISGLRAVLPIDFEKGRNVWAESLPHVLYVLEYDSFQGPELTRLGDKEDFLSLMWSSAAFCLTEGRLATAEVLFNRLTETLKSEFGEHYPQTLNSMANLAVVKCYQARWTEAEELQVKVLEQMQQVLGWEHSDTLTSMASLALTYCYSLRWTQAQKIQSEEVEVKKRVFGEDHPSSLKSMANLASIYYHQGRWAEAEKLQAEVLHKIERVLGVRHPDTLMVMTNLAKMYRDQGLSEKAEDLQARLTELGSLLVEEQSLSDLYVKSEPVQSDSHQGKLEEVTDFYERYVATHQTIFGPEHLNELSAFAALASRYSRHGRLQDAEILYAQLIATYDQAIGMETMPILQVVQNLGNLYRVQYRLEEAQQVYQRALAGYEKELGTDHKLTQEVAKSLSIVYRCQGQQEAAEQMLQRSALARGIPKFPRPTDRDGFQVAIICALTVESDAVEATFDAFYDEDEEENVDRYFGKAPSDQNVYTLGRIGYHNVVLAYLPSFGKTAFAIATKSLRLSFPRIRLGLVIGICGAVPTPSYYHDSLFLGDVIISAQAMVHQNQQELLDEPEYEDTTKGKISTLNQSTIAYFERLYGTIGQAQLKARFAFEIGAVCEKSRHWTRPPQELDRLFRADYRHKHQHSTDCITCTSCTTSTDPVCKTAQRSSCTELGCAESEIITQAERRGNPAERVSDTDSEPHPSKTVSVITSDDVVPVVHFGAIATVDTVIRSGTLRDAISKQQEVLAFEMEGAGDCDEFPTIIVKAASDYADGHGDKVWQQYAAASAAACAKAMLSQWQGVD